MNLAAFDLNLLLAFEALVEERSVTRAARRVGLSQPAMSNALGRLRRAFDDPLLVRTPDGMRPTAAARELIGPVRVALGHLRAAIEDRPAFDPAASTRVFRVLASDYVEDVLFVGVLAELSRRAPGIEVRLERPARLFRAPSTEALADGFDLALGFFPDVLTLDARLRSEALWSEENLCIARADHPVIRGRVSLDEFAAVRHVAVFYDVQASGVIDMLLARGGLARRLAVTTPHFSSIPPLVATTDLVATVPELLARRAAREYGLQALELPFELPTFRASMLWHARFDVDPAHAWLRGLVVDAARSMGPTHTEPGATG